MSTSVNKPDFSRANEDKSVSSRDCPLCRGQGPHVHIYKKPSDEEYYKCPACDLIFLLPEYYLDKEKERERYLEHDNNVEDPRYQNFVRPLFNEIKERLPAAAQGLDVGSGTGPVLTKLLTEAGFKMNLYDPYFSPNIEALNQKYDFVVSVEVVEHFYRPDIEFLRFKKLLRPGGVLGLMTSLTERAKDFSKWHYKSDPTHVVFYSEKTIQFICEKYGFKALAIKNHHVIILQGS